MRKKLNVIFASSMNRVIGKGYDLPWHIKRDLKFFQDVSTYYNNPKPADGVQKTFNAVIMGRKTWESMILSRSASPELEQELQIDEENHSVLFSTLEEALAFSDNEELINEVFIVGGSHLYAQVSEDFPDLVKNVFHTRIGQKVDGDIILKKGLYEGLELKELSKTYTQNGFNFDFARFVNPNLYSDYYQEFNTKVLNTQSNEYEYINLIKKILENGNDKQDRTGTGTLSLFGNMMRFDLSESFPLLTTKRVFWRGVVEEILWFLRGSTNAKDLADKGVHIWDGNATRDFLDKYGFPDREEGDLGPVYGFQWRHAGAEYTDFRQNYAGQGVDQIKQVIEMLKTDPDSRRIIVSAWNVKDINQMALPPCHALFQFYVENGKLSCLLYQRSCDVGLGVPFNIASYALLTCLVARIVGLQPGEFVHMMGDTHIYKNHVEALKEQIERDPRPFPMLDIKYVEGKPIEEYEFEDFVLTGYHPHKTIKMEMAV